MNPNRSRPWLALLAALTVTGALLPGCAPLVVGGAMVGGTLIAIDRRTSGAQVEDQSIEMKAGSRISDLATLGHVSVTSYNRLVLVTGEVPTEGDKQRVGESLQRMENVRSVVNELVVAPNSSMTARSNDSITSAKVKATFVDAKDMQANAIKVVTDRNVVYLMGRVTEREAGRAADLARTVSGVAKVVRVFELISEEELAGLTAKPPPPATPKP